MAIVIAPESELGKELAKWDAPKREGGMRCDGFEPYPALVYKAHRFPGSGKVMCLHVMAGTGDAIADAFTARCWREVKNAEEHDRANREGWSDGPDEAVAKFEKAEQAEAEAAAAAQFQARRMSDKAQAEFDAAQDAAEFHDAEVKAPKLAPKRPRNSKGQLLPKTAPATEPG